MSPRKIQLCLALVFLGLGAWVLLFPRMVLHLGLTPEYQTNDPVAIVLASCFGAQAILGGTVMALSRFTPITFAVLGLLGSVPFFVFNYLFVFQIPMFTPWMLVDALGNLAILALCLAGYRSMVRRGMATT